MTDEGSRFWLSLHSGQAQHSGQCAACGAQSGSAAKLKTCSRCRAVLYCSKECQNTHWGAHKAHCVLHLRLLDATLAGIVQPLAVTMADCCPEHRPLIEIGTGENSSYPDIVLRAVSLPGRQKKQLSLRFATEDGTVLEKSHNGDVVPLFHDVQGMKLDEPALVFADTLRLQPRLASVPVRYRQATKSWPAFPGLQRTPETACLSLKRSCDGCFSSTCRGIHRPMNAVPLAGKRTRKMASRLPIKGLKKSRQRGQLWNEDYIFDSKDRYIPLSQRLFALPGDHIISIWDATALDGNPLGLKPGSRIILADCNTSTGICRVLCKKGWILHDIGRCCDTGFDQLARSMAIGLLHNKLEPALQVAWPEGKRNMWERIVEYLKDAGWSGLKQTKKKSRSGKMAEKEIAMLIERIEKM